MHKHATSSVFLFTHTPADQWRLGLIRHPRLDRWMLPGGHVEDHENPAEAALREVIEESGHDARLLCPTRDGLPHVGKGVSVPPPLWIVEHQVPAETRHPQPHIHVDYLYLATSIGAAPAQPAELPFAWYYDSELDELDMFPDTRAYARLLFQHISDYSGHRRGPEHANLPTVAGAPHA